MARSRWSRRHSDRRIATRGRLRRRMRGALKGGAVVTLSLILTLFVGVASAAPGNRPPGGRLNDPVVRAVDVAEPSIVRIAALYLGHISLTLCGSTITLPASGDGYVTGGVGTGAFISANGDILTADHVVDIAHSLLDTEIFQSPISASAIAQALNAAPCIHFSQPVTESDVAAGIVQYENIPYQTDYSDPVRAVWRSTTFAGPSTGGDAPDLITSLMSAPHLEATVTSSSSFQANDLALLHVNLTDTPSIQLADSASIAAEDSLTVLGFPGNGDVSTNATDLLIPSVNTVSVSAIKIGANGAQLIQVSGNVEHGDSGGPAINSNGEIVGIVSFGGTEFPGSTAFLRASDNAKTLMAGAGINPTAGAFESHWQQAFADYAATYRGHWHRAARELDTLSAQYPSFAGVKPYQDYADSAARTEPIADSHIVGIAILGGAAALLVVAFALTIILLMQRRASKVAPVASQMAMGQWWYGYPYNPNGYPPSMTHYAQPPSYPSTPPERWAPAATTSQVPTGAPVPSAWPSQPSNGFGAPASPYTTPAFTPPSSAPRDQRSACINGHDMAVGEVYCAVCGAQRRPTDSAVRPSDTSQAR